MVKIIKKMKDIPWNILTEMKDWPNDRIIESFISSEITDLHGEVVSLDAMVESMPWLCEHGFYEYQHENFPIGEFLAWSVEDNKVKVRVGIFDSDASRFPEHDKIWEQIKEYGERGESSIKGIPNAQHQGQKDGDSVNFIDDIPLWAVGWVGDQAANPEADVTFVNEAAKTIEIPTLTRKQGEEVYNKIIKGNGEEDMKPTKKQDEEEEAPEEEMPEEEAPTEGVTLEEVAEAQTIVTEALADIDAGTPEVVEEIAEAAEQALAVLDGGEYDEMKKRVNELEKKLVDAMKVIKNYEAKNATLHKRLETPITAKRGVPVQPVQKQNTIDVAKGRALIAEGKTREGYQVLGYRHN